MPRGADTTGTNDTVLAEGRGAPSSALSSSAIASSAITSTQGRTTVLPKRAQAGAPPSMQGDRRFHHVKPLGEGGMGEVLLAHDDDIQRRVAIKRIRTDRANDAALLRFADEVRIIGQLEHPSIVPVHDVGVDDAGQVYLVMKFVEGETLEHVIERLRAGDPTHLERFPIRERVEIVAKILEALSYAHSRGFVHRDLKPANVMVGPHGEVTLMDWGIAKRIGTPDPQVDELASTDQKHDRLVETQSGSLLGTPMYMSPEQAAGRNAELDARSDVFSAGLVAMELFTLRHPLENMPALSAVIATLVHTNLGTPRALGPYFTGVPAELFWFCVRALSQDKSARFADAEGMLTYLRELQGGRVKVQCPITATKAATNGFLRLVDRSPRLWMMILSASALVVVGSLAFAAWTAVRAITH